MQDWSKLSFDSSLSFIRQQICIIRIIDLKKFKTCLFFFVSNNNLTKLTVLSKTIAGILTTI